jgi:hypothetical protein
MTENEVTSSGIDESSEPIQRILELVERALELSDLAGLTFVAIDLSSARDKLVGISCDRPSTNC